MKVIRHSVKWFPRFETDAYPWLRSWQARQLSVAAILWLVVTAIFTLTLFAHRVDVVAGDIAPRTVVAPFGVIDWPATARAREAAARAIPNVYIPDPGVLTAQRQKLNHEFLLLAELSNDAQAPLSTRVQAAAEAIPVNLPGSVWEEVLTLPPGTLEQLHQDASVILASVMGNGNEIRNTPLGLAEARSFVSKLAVQEETDSGLRLFLTDVTQSLVVPNTSLNRQVTAQRRAEAAAAVPVVKILKGEVVLQQGQVVTAADMDVLRQLGLLDNGFDPGPVIGSLLFSAALVVVLAGYLWVLRKKLAQSPEVAILTSLIVVVGLLAADTLSGVQAVSYLVVPTSVMLVTALIDTGLGLVMAGMMSLAITVLTGSDLNVALVSFLGGVAGVFGVSRLSERYDILRAGLLVGLVDLLVLLGLDIMEGAALLQAPVWQGLVWALADGLVAAILTMGSILLLEGPFSIITAMKLIELANPNQPLLRKLLVEAPGTYHHSIMVGNLAEAATEAVGGNSLLARVGAYYHDIGKSKRPYFFIDNQFGAENPHDKLSPVLSALIISSHVRDGVELAQAYRIPEAIVNFIRQHHGTTLISYFYRKALEADTGEGVDEEDFRYDGPRPQSKETAIVMLADASEATTRTLKNPTPQAIEQVVRRIIKDRLQDGQLDESDLTLKELDIIAQTFTRILTGVFHQRIEYPDKVLKEMERSHKRGNMGGKPPRMVRRMGGNGSAGGPHGSS